MSFRVEPLPDGSIEIMRPREGRRPRRYYAFTLESACSMFRFLLKRDIASRDGDQFVPQFKKEARRAFKTLEEKSPYAKSK